MRSAEKLRRHSLLWFSSQKGANADFPSFWTRHVQISTTMLRQNTSTDVPQRVVQRYWSSVCIYVGQGCVKRAVGEETGLRRPFPHACDRLRLERKRKSVCVFFPSSFFDSSRWSVQSLIVNRRNDYYPLVKPFPFYTLVEVPSHQITLGVVLRIRGERGLKSRFPDWVLFIFVLYTSKIHCAL